MVGSAGKSDRATLIGIISVVGATFAFSINDMAIKFMSGSYPLPQIMFFRSLVAVAITLCVLVPLEGAFESLRSVRSVLLVRGLLVLVANVCFFSSLASLPLSSVTAIFFVSPLLITAFSVIFLAEWVGWRRWLAVGIGFVGVLFVMRPGSDAFQYASLLPLVAAACTGFSQILTRKLGLRARASVLAFYVHFVLLLGAIVAFVSFGDGRFAGTGNVNLEFVFGPWLPVGGLDLAILLGIGLFSGLGTYLITQGYRLCQAGVAAPFEYTAMPLGVFWSIVVWGHWPDLPSWFGIGLIAVGGLFLFLREALLGAARWRRANRPL